MLCQRTFSSVFRADFFYTFKLHSITKSVWGPLECMGSFRVYGPFRVHGVLPGVWGPLVCMDPLGCMDHLGCMGHFRVHGALKVCLRNSTVHKF